MIRLAPSDGAVGLVKMPLSSSDGYGPAKSEHHLGKEVQFPGVCSGPSLDHRELSTQHDTSPRRPSQNQG